MVKVCVGKGLRGTYTSVQITGWRDVSTEKRVGAYSVVDLHTEFDGCLYVTIMLAPPPSCGYKVDICDVVASHNHRRVRDTA